MQQIAKIYLYEGCSKRTEITRVEKKKNVYDRVEQLITLFIYTAILYN